MIEIKDETSRPPANEGAVACSEVSPSSVRADGFTEREDANSTDPLNSASTIVPAEYADAADPGPEEEVPIENGVYFLVFLLFLRIYLMICFYFL